MDPQLSVVIPAFNKLDYLQQLLDSLRPQVNGHQVIVINDASTDRQVRSFLDKQDWLCVINQSTNKGSSAARNIGILNATSDRVVFIDSDCIASKDFIQRHVKFHSKFPHEGVVGNTVAVSQDKSILRFLEYGSSPMFGISERGYGSYEKISFHFFFTCNASVPRRSLLKAGLFDERYNGAWDDIELGYRLDQDGLEFRYDPDMLVSHHHPTTVPQFLQRQIRVGKGYYRVSKQHPELLGSLQFDNQLEALKTGLSANMSKGKSTLEKAEFIIFDFLGRLFMWYGYLAENRSRQ
jgi:mycofactocin glycosyltransferase